ncbi:monovalent cation/H+ antiporter subunit A [Sphingomonas flavalba]|uniref:monovalent cation/H+ antiporter subunit A n=1 Tax=Sphingomonas flavalba TaxID=2559804 RepID=UPI0039E04785
MFEEWPLFILFVLPFLGSLAAAFLPTWARNAAAGLAGTIAVVGLAILIALYPSLSGDGVVREQIQWLPSLGLNLQIRLDGLAWLFAFLILGIGALVVLYARYYMSPADPVPRFFSFLLAFMGSMLGVVLSGNLIQLVFFWELTSLFSFLLIGYWHHNQSARDGARIALVVTAAGGVCLLVGVLLLGRIVGSYDLDTILASGDRIRANGLYTPALILILIGAFTKSAQVPFHFWLPHAMAAPTPVSSYLHSATMVKAGIFVLMRLWPVLSGTDEWYLFVTTTGLATLLVGAWSAIFQQDLKGLLAYSTISHLGLITLLLGLGSPLALVAAIFHTVNHATFKASLFMAAGIIDHETGTRDLRRLSGLYRAMPITATLAMVAAAAMAGVPLLNGFLSKEMFLAEALAEHSGTYIDEALPYLATVASAFAVLYSLRFIHQTFFGPPPTDLPRVPGEAPPWMRLPVEILVLACLVVGVLPTLTIGPYLATAVRSILGDQTPAYSLAIWHGFNRPLMMSLVALVGGTILYLIYRKPLNEAKSSPVVGRLKGRKTFEAVMSAIVAGARACEAVVGTGRLQAQLRVLLCIALVAGGLPFVHFGYSLGQAPGTLVDPAFAIVWLIGGACAIGAAWQAKYHRLAALILMSGSGLATCITFFWLSAPDLGITQLLVEIVTTVLLLLGLRWLPKRLPEMWSGNRWPPSVLLRRSSDLAIAIAAGLGMAAIAYAIMTRPPPDSISRYFLERSYTEAGGTNVVNVILVDFRGFDTLGEITVLCIVALTVFSLLRRFRPAPESVKAPVQQRVQNAFDDAHADRKIGDTVADYLAIPRIMMEISFPIIIVFAIYILLRGHDAPGGGFAAGIAMSIAILIQYMAKGARQVEAQLIIRPLRWIGIGLLLATVTGAGAWLLGYPFLSSYFRYVDLPLFGTIPVASALLFDIGVFALVVGATVVVLIALAHQSIRVPRPSRPATDKEEGA